MRVEVLVATMNRETPDFIEAMNLQTDAVIINQCGKVDYVAIEKDEQHIKFISFDEKGLSKSRNRALEAAQGDICLIADDDVNYIDNYEDKILETYKEYPDADIIAFQVTRIGKIRTKRFRSEPHVENWFSCMKIGSVEITFKRKSILDRGIKFDTLFGAGAKYFNGEENIFLYDCLRQKMKIVYVPILIGSVFCEVSTWFNGYNEEFFRCMGAGYYGLSKKWSYALIGQHLIRRYKLYKENARFLQILKWMIKGRSECKKTIRERTREESFFVIGDFVSEVGPGIVNKNLMNILPKQTMYSVAKSKLTRILELSIKMRKCEVIIFSGLSYINIIGIKLAKKMGKCTIYIMHGYVKQENEINHEEASKLVQQEAYILEHIDKVFCVSERFKNHMQKKVPEYSYKIDYINNGIVWNQNISKEVACKQIKDEYTLVSVGGGVRQKNNLKVCKAIQQLNETTQLSIKFIVIGKPHIDKQAICQYPFVDYKDHMPHRDVLEMLKRCDLYIQNSYFESYGIAIVEALLSGANVLISQHVGMLSILENYEETDLIQDVDDIDEIATKIQFNLLNQNHDRLLNAINREKTSWEYSGMQLRKKIKEFRNKGFDKYEHMCK